MSGWGFVYLFLAGLFMGVALGIAFCEWLDKCAAADADRATGIEGK